MDMTPDVETLRADKLREALEDLAYAVRSGRLKKSEVEALVLVSQAASEFALSILDPSPETVERLRVALEDHGLLGARIDAMVRDVFAVLVAPQDTGGE